MDCIQAQSVISEAIDRSPVDATVLEEAKAHCRECPQCGQFVRTLSAVRRAVLPQPPANLTDRIMATIRAEAAAAALSELEPSATSVLVDGLEGPSAGTRDGDDLDSNAAVLAVDTLADSSDSSTSGEPSESQPITEPAGQSLAHTPRISLGQGRMDRHQLIAWGSAAAVLLVVVGVSAALGIMRLVSGGGSSAATSDRVQMAAPEAAAPKVAAESGAVAGGDADSTNSGAASSVAPVTPSLYVVFGGDAYVLQGASNQTTSKLRVVGETRMSFNANTRPTLRSVYTEKEPGSVYIQDDAGNLQRFLQVRRDYQGTSYRLRSADLLEYGAWPSMPPGIPKPIPENNEDGSPVFTLDGQDASGTPVYHRVGADTRVGIAIPPGTAAEDPAAGNPNWTWWVR